ncbi:ArfGap-domain-containing protein [Suhomyces tanzawaensis NRRL Y-17324]|uniref:ArfGap-domain-containing protein n=1 Tax=Suhomyces tanzawaensis NRRL Y-17324 TaxID=984487 RepID=A0A1E4SS83_9ASCO|nr:ArfGap-domain-containing protein [Suhomyces tanzawaensis NRRL Y-17324]ODV82364.1 ArfGap-domain-containing protein [Suhomyces tanzawaensis NRRL Y-17324]
MSYRSSSALPSSKKTHSEKHKQILKQLLKENANKSCSDCKTAKNPRWASWNLGCFVCIRCSGIHRSMGTHISKVKSVDLDAWTDEQVELMIKWGNEKCNAYWEAQLPEGYVPNQLKIENFIRTKYDLKKWALSPKVPDPMTLTTSSPAAQVETPAVPSKSSTPSLPSNDLLSFSGALQPQPSVPSRSASSLLDDDFGSFTSSPSPKPQPPAPQPQASFARGTQHTQSAQSTGGSMNSATNGRPDLKKSILSLYSSPSSSSSFIPQQPRQTYNNSNNANINNLSNSLNGLNFNTTSSVPSPAPATNYGNSNTGSPSSTSNSGHASTASFNSYNNSNATSNANVSQNKQTTWNNEWNDSGSSLPKQWGNSSAPASNNTLKVNGLDDDLFKNVWS